ncbi:hypothetical protein ACLBWS_06210 [Brucellaceae bacterium D45D]
MTLVIIFRRHALSSCFCACLYPETASHFWETCWRQIAETYLNASYRDVSRADYFGLSEQEFVDTLYESGTIWVPDGDAAFDDGSHILQFDAGNRVRIIAFVNTDVHEDVASTIREVWMDADLFYAIATGWVTLFEAERASILKAGRCPLM